MAVSLNIGKYGLPIVGFAAITFMFLKGEKSRTRALTIMGFGFIFLGLELMSTGLSPLRTLPEFIELFHSFKAHTFLGVIKVALVGALLTAVVQSSAATLGITITWLYKDLLIILLLLLLYWEKMLDNSYCIICFYWS